MSSRILPPPSRRSTLSPGSVTINGRFLTQPTTGVQRYAREVVRELSIRARGPGASDSYYRITTPKRGVDASFRTTIPFQQTGTFKGHLWEQVELPKSVTAGRTCLLSLCNTGPVVTRKQVVVMHDVATLVAPEGFSEKFARWYRWLIPTLGRRVARVVTISEFSKQELITHAGIPESKISVVLEGADHMSRIQADPSILPSLPQQPFVLAVSSLNPNKNFATVVQAARQLEREGINFVIAGGSDPRVFARSGLELPANVTHVGYVSDGELRTLYERAACFVFPSLYEGFGLPPLEAMACGCPVVASARASLPEVCGEAAVYCHEPEQAQELASCVMRVMSDVSLQKEMRAKGFTRARNFTWKQCAQSIHDIVHEVMNS